MNGDPGPIDSFNVLLLNKLQALPGVRAVGVTSLLPVAGQDVPPSLEKATFRHRAPAEPGLGIPVDGRLFPRCRHRLGLLGCVIGVFATVFATRLLWSLLFEIDPLDPVVIVLAAVSIFLLALAASIIPAYRAARIEPVEALRTE